MTDAKPYERSMRVIAGLQSCYECQMSFQALGRFGAISCLVALIVLSWLPHELEIRTGLPGQIEHVIAYFGTALLVRSAFLTIRTRTLLFGLVALAAILEVGQLWVPGRNSQWIDFVSSSFGALFALTICHLGRSVLKPNAYALNRRASER